MHKDDDGDVAVLSMSARQPSDLSSSSPSPSPPSLPKWLVSSTGEGRDRGAFWDNISGRSRYWSSMIPCFTNTRWQHVGAGSWTESLRRTMAGSWWSITSLQPRAERRSSEETRPALARVSRLSLTQRRRAMALLGGQPSSSPSSFASPSLLSSNRPAKSLGSVSSWRTVMDEALQRVDSHASLPEGQPWRKQQQAMLQTARKKANRTKKKKNSVTTTESRPKEKDAGTKHKRKKQGKERVPLDEQEDADNNDAEEEVIPFDGKCQKIRIFPNSAQKVLLKEWFGTARWTYNACNAAVRAGLCDHDVDELKARFLDPQAFGMPPARRRTAKNVEEEDDEGTSSNRKRKKKKKKIVHPLSEEEKQMWQETLGPMGHMPCAERRWVLKTPTDIRSQAIEELCQAYRNGIKAHGTRAGFEVKFKSLKTLSQQCITINARDWNRTSSNKSEKQQSIFCQLFDCGQAMRASEPLPCVMEREFDVVRTQLGRYYLCIPTDLQARGEEQAPPSSDDNLGAECVFIDPGVRTFATCFDLQGRIHEFGGAGSIKRIERLCGHLDSLISRTFAKKEDDKSRFVLGKKKRWRMRRAVARMRRRIRNIVDEMHRKVALWLCENYRVILWPLSNVKSMTRKGKKRKKKKKKGHKEGEVESSTIAHVPTTSCRSSSSPPSGHDGDELACENQARKEQLKEYKRKLDKRSVRNMMTWSWYRFQQWLKHKVREFPWCRLVLVSEAYTTRTCTLCGTDNNHVDRDRIFRCANKSCINRRADRDHHGARNIGLRFLTEWASMTLPQSLSPSPTVSSSSSGSSSSSRVVIDLTLEED